MRESAIPTHLVIELLCEFERDWPPKTRTENIGGTRRCPLGRTAIVGNQNDRRVLADPQFVERRQQTTDVVIYVGHQPGEDLHVTRVELALPRTELIPGLSPKRQRRELGRLWHHAQFTLALQTPCADNVPAFVVLALVGIALTGTCLQR